MIEILQSHYDDLGKVYKFEAHVKVDTSETWLLGYIGFDNKIRITDVRGNPHLADLGMAILYTSIHEDYLIELIRKAQANA